MHTGQLEGINNRIKVMKRMAYGYRDGAYFFLKAKAAYSVMNQISASQGGAGPRERDRQLPLSNAREALADKGFEGFHFFGVG